MRIMFKLENLPDYSKLEELSEKKYNYFNLT